MDISNYKDLLKNRNYSDFLKNLKKSCLIDCLTFRIINTLLLEIINTNNKTFVQDVFHVGQYNLTSPIVRLVSECNMRNLKFLVANYRDVIEQSINDLLVWIMVDYSHKNNVCNRYYVNYESLPFDTLQDKMNHNLLKVKYLISNFGVELNTLKYVFENLVSPRNPHKYDNFVNLWSYITSNLNLLYSKNFNKRTSYSIGHPDIKKFINDIFNVVTKPGCSSIMKYLVSQHRGVIKLDSYDEAFKSCDLEVIKYAMTFAPKYKVSIKEYLITYCNKYRVDLVEFVLQKVTELDLDLLIQAISLVGSYGFTRIICNKIIGMIIPIMLKFMTPICLYNRLKNYHEVVEFLMVNKYITEFEPLNITYNEGGCAHIYYLGYYYNLLKGLNLDQYKCERFIQLLQNNLILNNENLEGLVSIFPDILCDDTFVNYKLDKKFHLASSVRYYTLILMSNPTMHITRKLKKIKHSVNYSYLIELLNYTLPKTQFEHLVDINTLLPQEMLVRRWKTGFRHVMNFNTNFWEFSK